MLQAQPQAQVPVQNELLLAGFVNNNDDLAQLIKNYTLPPDVEGKILMLLECQPHHVIKHRERQDLLYFAPFNPDFNFEPYTSGRIFHQYAELRWEKQSSRIHVVYTGQNTYQPQLAEHTKEELDGTYIPKAPRRYLLFGKRLDQTQLERIGPVAQPGDFAEARIPRLLHYPLLSELASAEQVQVDVCEYVNAETGANVAYRFKGLIPFEKR